jgi:acetyl-CoA carboxylase biotin carboxyl carrier protein
MDLTREDVLEILELLERSNVEYLEVAVGETKLVASKTGAGLAPAPGASSGAAHDASAAPRPVDRPVPGPEAAAPALAAGGGPRPSLAEGDVAVPAPVVGTFYRAPEPGAPPYVEAGSTVAEGDTVGIVEVMKMFTSVTAPTAGTVVDIFTSNGEIVEYGQPLMSIRPAGKG